MKLFDLAIGMSVGIGNLMKNVEGNCAPADTYDLRDALLHRVPSQPGVQEHWLLATPVLKYKSGKCHTKEHFFGARYTQVTEEQESKFVNGNHTDAGSEDIGHDALAYYSGDTVDNVGRASSLRSRDSNTPLSHLLSNGSRSLASSSIRQVQDSMNLALQTLGQFGISTSDIEAVVEDAPVFFLSFFNERECQGGRSPSMPPGLDIISSLDFSIPSALLGFAGVSSGEEPKMSGTAVLSLRTSDTATVLAKLSEGIIATEGPNGKIRNQICAFSDNPETFNFMAKIAGRTLDALDDAFSGQLTAMLTPPGTEPGQPPVESKPASNTSTPNLLLPSPTESPPSKDKGDLSSTQTLDSPAESVPSTTATRPPTLPSAATSGDGVTKPASVSTAATPSSDGTESTSTTTVSPETFAVTSTESTVAPTGTGSVSTSTTAAACFPGEATVELEDGTHLPLRELRVGDSVRSSRYAFTKVIMFSHADREAKTDFIIIEAGSFNRALALSPNHYLPTFRAAEGWKLVAAASVRVGDLIINGTAEDRTDEHLEVTAVTRTRMSGLFNPQTASGSIVVNGVYASTFTTAVPVPLAKALLMPLCLASNLFGVVFPSLSIAFRQGAVGIAGILPEGTSRLDL